MASDKYDPSHRDSDWSGFVPSISSKKHIESPPLQIESLSTGICPTDDATTNEWKPGRRNVKDNVNSKTNGGNRNGSSSSNSDVSDATFTLIGGPIPENDPTVVGSSNWQTEAQAASLQMETTMGQKTEMGRSMHIRGKKSSVPAYENAKPFDKSVAAMMRRENPYKLNDEEGRQSHCIDTEAFDSHNAFMDGTNDDNNLIGYRSHRGGQARSFLDGLGKELAASIPPSKHVIAPAPYATEGGLPTDPYATQDGGRRKDLLLENYSGKRGH